MKTCTKCGQTKPLSEFYKQAKCKHGVAPRCKTCTRAVNAAYRKANPDKVKAGAAAYRKANSDEVRASKARHYQANRNKFIARAAEWHRVNPEKVAAINARYQQANPHIGWECDYRTRCRKLGLNPVVVSFTREDVVAQYGDGCFYCDDGAFEELEHYIPVAAHGPHTLDNARPSCHACNQRKVRTTDRVLINVYRTVAVAVADHFAQLTHLEP